LGYNKTNEDQTSFSRAKSEQKSMTSIFVAKLDFGVDNAQLKAIFDTYGTVLKATVATDRETGKSRGFGFVEMANDDEAQDAIQALDNSTVSGRTISVKQAEDRSNGPKKPFVKGGDFTPRDNSSGDRPPRPAFSDNNDSRPPFVPQSDFGGMARKKKDDLKKGDKPKTHKMEAYKKSGKEGSYLSEDDETEEDFDMFGRDEDADQDEDYSKYLVNSSDEEEEYDDDDEEDDEED
jgi:RNA recognition motif-containing protein